MFKNTASQKWYVFAFNETDNTPKTGDAANITANLRIDGGAANAVDDTNPTELEDGYYYFDITQAESNGDYILICPESSTANIQVVGCPAAVFTRPPNFNALGIESDGDVTKVNTLDGHTAQSANHTTNIAAILDDTGTDGVKLADDAITSGKYDESTAFPVKSVDSGATQIARVGADGDTLETLSDQLDSIGTIGGAGAYATTITIRTTGGTPISGVSVWVNTSNDISGAVAGASVTGSSGEVTFNLDYNTYYVFCTLAGYNFASASFTSSAGNVTFTKDIATATSAGSSNFYADSFLSRSIVDIKESIDEPTQKAKYTDARIIEHLEKSYILILNEINRNSRTQVVGKVTKTLASGTNAYVLPHTSGAIYGIYKTDSSGGKVFYDSRSRYNVFGRSMHLEGQTLHLQDVDTFGIGTEITIEYTPSGVARLHNGTCTLNAAGDVVTFGATPNAGTLDTHHEAYTGCVLRILGVDGSTITGNYLQERIITAYDETTREATLDSPLSPIPTTDDGNIYYEIAPTISKGMDTVVALYAAYRIIGGEGNTKRANGILSLYRNELRNVRLSSYYSLMPSAPVDRQDSFDNRRHNRL